MEKTFIQTALSQHHQIVAPLPEYFLVVLQVCDHLADRDLTLRLDLVEHIGGRFCVGLQGIRTALHFFFLRSGDSFRIVNNGLRRGCVKFCDLGINSFFPGSDVFFLLDIRLTGRVQLLHEFIVLTLLLYFKPRAKSTSSCSLYCG